MTSLRQINYKHFSIIIEHVSEKSLGAQQFFLFSSNRTYYQKEEKRQQLFSSFWWTCSCQIRTAHPVRICLFWWTCGESRLWRRAPVHSTLCCAVCGNSFYFQATRPQTDCSRNRLHPRLSAEIGHTTKKKRRGNSSSLLFGGVAPSKSELNSSSNSFKVSSRVPSL